MGVNSLPKTVIRQRRDCNLNPSAPESSTLATQLPSHPTECMLELISQRLNVSHRAGTLSHAVYV